MAKQCPFLFKEEYPECIEEDCAMFKFIPIPPGTEFYDGGGKKINHLGGYCGMVKTCNS